MDLLSKQLDQLIIYQHVLEDPIVNIVYELVQSLDNTNEVNKSNKLYSNLHRRLIQNAETNGLSGHLWKNHLGKVILLDENAFTLSCEKHGYNIGKSIYDIAVHDLNILRDFYNIDWQLVSDRLDSNYSRWIEDYIPTVKDSISMVKFNDCHLFPEDHTVAKIVYHLIDFHDKNGCGQFINHTSFRWDKGLVPIENPDPITFDHLFGYELQKKALIKNTEAFLRGQEANNVLLVGHRGTGKSSSVKALVNKYYDKGLRIIEISKHQLTDFHHIIHAIKDRGQRFIIFMDDLSFEDFEVEYKNMKAIIEGGVEIKPENMLIYATSNRRHLIKENWSEREGGKGDVHVMDSIQEKLSLSDRFGITITYSAPNQDEYLEIVRGLALKHSISLSWDELRQRAIKWELWHNGRSGRSAQQFITSLLGEE